MRPRSRRCSDVALPTPGRLAPAGPARPRASGRAVAQGRRKGADASTFSSGTRVHRLNRKRPTVREGRASGLSGLSPTQVVNPKDCNRPESLKTSEPETASGTKSSPCSHTGKLRLGDCKPVDRKRCALVLGARPSPRPHNDPPDGHDSTSAAQPRTGSLCAPHGHSAKFSPPHGFQGPPKLPLGHRT